MKGNNYCEIFWKQVNSSTFMYGTKLTFKDRITIFENALMPSGIIIQDWVMRTNYALDKELPTLPILKRGRDYTFQFNYEVEAQQALYFKIVFYSKDGTILSTQIIKDKQANITYPDLAYNYKIQMINAAAKLIKFENITIIEQQLDDSKTDSVEISDVVNVDAFEAVRNVIFVEPSQWFDAPLSSLTISHLKNVVTVNGWYENITECLSDIKEYIVRMIEDYNVHLISYGPKGNELVSYLTTLVQTQSFITTDEDIQFKKHLSRKLNKQIVSVQTSCEIYFDPKDETNDVANQAISTVLNPSRYLKYLDVERMNHGGPNETEN